MMTSRVTFIMGSMSISMKLCFGFLLGMGFGGVMVSGECNRRSLPSAMSRLLFIDILPESCNREDEQNGNENRDHPSKNHHPAAPSKVSIVHHSEHTVVLLHQSGNSMIMYPSPSFRSLYGQNMQPCCSCGCLFQRK